MTRRKGQKRNSSQTARPVERPARRRPGGKAPARPPTAGGDSSSDDEKDNRAAPLNEAPVHAPFKAPDPTRTVLLDEDDDDSSAPPPPGSPRCVVCSTTHDVFIVERAKDLLRAEFYAWCCSSCARDVWKTKISVSGARNSARTRRKILISHRRGNTSSRGRTRRSSISPRTTTSRSAP